MRKVGEFGWEEWSKKRDIHDSWHKLIFEVEVKGYDIKLDPMEHQDHLWATEEEIKADQVGDVTLSWITPVNKEMNLQAFQWRREREAQGNTASL